ncbi:MAG: chemotaxis response regulator protein-glutamate methylesterase [endosymbiont of Galathealinum brachiosum]|uniref:Protein-glutamate methylesterase/protein-glutamine glutaminase n=1 Tax=endosymbiont of Galathealinum brachiosum TaxID=2200906 RepID=A0A370DLG1_9GAMM|nr:MAG: chemotaxis response regulator protein-glutamate methylesterase [endosymbiont of Galathealinum brachiosum]
MVVDDSALVRKVMTDVLSSDPGIKVISQAPDPIFAMQKMKKEMPDVITLDIEMPRMDGITFLQKLMTENPLPVVICSSLAREAADTTLSALRAGAVDIITKPEIGVKGFIQDSSIQIINAVKGAAKARVKKRASGHINVAPKQNADAILSKGSINTKAMSETTDKLIAIGASTGGTEALRTVLAGMPAISPGVVIVQHMPEKFTTAFAGHLNEISAMEVREAKNGDRLRNGVALLAPGGKHMLLKRSGAQYHVDVVDGPLVSRHRPSVDVLFRSVARFAGANATACILTGMGDDGATGLKEIRDAGGRTFSQDEETSVVYGMPKEAWKRGASERQLALGDVAFALLKTSQEKVKKK